MTRCEGDAFASHCHWVQNVQMNLITAGTVWVSPTPWSGGSSTADCMWTDKLKSSLEKLNFWFFSSSFFTIDFKIFLYARGFDTSYCPHNIFWLHFVNSSKLWENKMCQWTSCKFSVIKLFSQSFGELTRCSQNMSCGQCEVSKCLAYNHILKSIVRKLEEKNQKFNFFGTWINFNQVCSSHAICRAVQSWWYPQHWTCTHRMTKYHS